MQSTKTVCKGDVEITPCQTSLDCELHLVCVAAMCTKPCSCDGDNCNGQFNMLLMKGKLEYAFQLAWISSDK